MEHSSKRNRLHELDEILDALEQLNLREVDTLPQDLVDRLSGIGITTSTKANVTDLIERVWGLQEQFLSAPAQGSEGRGEPSWRRGGSI